MKKDKEYIQGSLFEEDYLIRTLGNLCTSPEIALTELVANAWDAGATRVKIFIPDDNNQKLIISDNGIGLTKEEFYERWMKLGYNRIKYQGKRVEFPNNISLQRIAYGRNGIGRHGLLCFNNEYKVTTMKKGKKSIFTVSTTNEKDPFVIKQQKFSDSQSHGTKLEVLVEKNLPNPNRILDVISARFLHDPKFILTINGNSLQLEDFKGLLFSEPLIVDNLKLKIHLIDTKRSRKSTLYQGIAFWQGGRLIGEPSWIIGKTMVLDGRTKFAKRYSVVVQTNDLADYVLEDWSGFKKSDYLLTVFEEIDNCIQKMFSKIAMENIDETTKQIKKEFSNEYRELSPLSKFEFNETIQNITITNPTARQDSINLAVKAILNLQQTRSGSELLQKLSSLSEEDIIGLNQLLSNWSIKDALSVLEEIDNRITVIEAIRKLSKDRTVNELQFLHPLVTNARWVFGPEYDSPEYTSNRQLQTSVDKIFGKKLDKKYFINHKDRPDIVVKGESTFSITGTSSFDNEDNLMIINKILIIELKRGGSKLGRNERNQALDYVEDFMNCGSLIGSPYINAFVVGETFKEKIQPVQKINNKNNVEMGKVKICLFSQIVDSAEKRLFNLRDRLNERYANIPGMELYYRQSTINI